MQRVKEEDILRELERVREFEDRRRKRELAICEKQRKIEEKIMESVTGIKCEMDNEVYWR